IFAADVPNAILGGGGGDLLPSENAVILRGLFQLLSVDLGIAGDDGHGVAGALAGIDLKRDGNLLVSGVALDYRRDGGEVEAVALQKIFYAANGGIDIFIAERRAELEARSIG